jgi:hypothetical protein
MKLVRGCCKTCVAALALLGVGLGLTAGCASDGGDDASLLSDFARSAQSTTPGEAAREAFNRYDPDARRKNVTRLAQAPFGGEAVYLDLYRLLLDDPVPTVRAACIRALGRHGTPADAQQIEPLLTDDNDFVRWEAAKAMKKLHHPVAIDSLIERLNEDTDLDVRMAAAQALGQYPRPRVFDALVGALDDPEYGVSRAAAQSLRTLTGAAFDRDAGDWLAWARANRRSLFDEGAEYTYQPYDGPPGLWYRVLVDPVLFWKEPQPPEPKVPAGLRRPS